MKTRKRKPSPRQQLEAATRALLPIHEALMTVEFHDGWALCKCEVAAALRWVNERKVWWA